MEVGETKNNDAKTVCLDEELKEIFQNQWKARRRKVTPFVFPNKQGTDQNINLRRAWNTACREIGIGYGYKLFIKYVQKWEGKLPAGPTFHDFRRTVVRNMVRSGIPGKVAMMISGHKTRSVFDRYNIVSDADLKLAAQRQEAYLETQMGTILGTITQFKAKKVSSKS